MHGGREAVGARAVVTQTPRDSGVRSTDQSVVRRIAQGDRSALAELYDRYGTAVYSLACRIVGSSADAEDVTQEVFTQAWKQAARYDEGRASAVAWLLNMTRTRAIDRIRANRTRLKFAGEPARLDAVPDGGADAEQRAIDVQRASRVRSALEGLASAQRQAIELAFFGGLTHGEIAERLGEPLGTVKTRIRTALTKLRGALVDQM
jgi:RNA polymerase sigma-70 factor (ECF subfamily)